LEAYYNVLRGVMTRYAISLTPAAWDMLTAPVLEAHQHGNLDLDEAVRSSELLVMSMAFEHAGGHNTQSVVRAFARNKAAIPPFTEQRL
jgi:hypothetical protein